MSDKKRKRPSEKADGPRKKVAPDAPLSVVKVTAIPESDEWAPVIGVEQTKPLFLLQTRVIKLIVVASTPGLSFSSKTPFKAYRKRRHNTPIRPPGSGGTSLNAVELLLHSSTHPKIDYTGREEEAGGSDSLLRHYVGIYDPETSELRVVPARKLVVRGSVRQPATPATAQHEDEEDAEPASQVRGSPSPHFQPCTVTNWPTIAFISSRSRPLFRHQEIPKSHPCPDRERHFST